MPKTGFLLVLAFALSATLGWPALAQQSPQGVPADTAASPQGTLEADVEAALRRMSATIGAAQAFTVRMSTLREVRLSSEQAVLLSGVTAIAARRPDHLYVSVGSDLGSFDLWYDGSAVTLLKPIEKLYAAGPLTGNLEQAVIWLEDRLGIQIPARPLVAVDPYSAMMEAGDTTGVYLGRSYVRDVAVDHFALRNSNAAWEIWLEANDRALPRRVSVVQAAENGPLRVTLEFEDWNLSPTLADSTFVFTPPPDAMPATMVLRPE